MENNNKEESREFYVYKHIRKDNNTCFYVGKGKGRRIYVPKRNKHHDRIAKRYGYYVVKVKENLTEKEAFALEREIIEDYVFVFGYGINIKGYRDYSDKKYLTNSTWGGEGTSGLTSYNKGKKGLFHHSEEAKQKIGEKSKGRNPYENKTPEEMQITKQRMSKAKKGKHLSEEHKKNIGKKVSGEKNGMWGKKGKDSPIYGEKNGMWGKPAHNRSKVICITTGKIFNSQTEAEKYYSCSGISKCCNGKIQSAGKLNGIRLQWKYLKDYNGEFKGILINPIITK